jgi:hypothetical protein
MMKLSVSFVPFSVRHTMHIVNCAKIGADVMTGPLSAIWFVKTPVN